MMEQLLWTIERTLPKTRPFIWKFFYNFLAKKFSHPEWIFMNYGYATDDLPEPPNTFDSINKVNYYATQLYERALKDIDVSSKNVLEIGSGRGGGCTYIATQKQPKLMVGVDIAKNAITFCRKVHNYPNLFFMQGNAGDIPFPDESFDVIINIESSHHYPSFVKFLSDCHRLLKKGGYLTIADYRNTTEMKQLGQELQQSLFKFDKTHDITRNVILSLDRLDEAKESLIKKHARLKNYLRQLTATKKSYINQAFRLNTMQYFIVQLKK